MIPAPHVSADGVLAQLGARNIRNVEATGSNPVYSTMMHLSELEGVTLVVTPLVFMLTVPLPAGE